MSFSGERKQLPISLLHRKGVCASQLVSIAVGHITGSADVVYGDEACEATAHPLVQAALAVFPGATIEAVRPIQVGPAVVDDDASEEEAPPPFEYDEEPL